MKVTYLGMTPTHYFTYEINGKKYRTKHEIVGDLSPEGFEALRHHNLLMLY